MSSQLPNSTNLGNENDSNKDGQDLDEQELATSINTEMIKPPSTATQVDDLNQDNHSKASVSELQQELRRRRKPIPENSNYPVTHFSSSATSSTSSSNTGTPLLTRHSTGDSLLWQRNSSVYTTVLRTKLISSSTSSLESLQRLNQSEAKVITPPSQQNSNQQVAEEDESNQASIYECNICFESASDPVVTFCGHLFCWPCLHTWFKSCTTRHQALLCPVCKAGTGQDKVVPIFSRGVDRSNTRTTVGTIDNSTTVLADAVNFSFSMTTPSTDHLGRGTGASPNEYEDIPPRPVPQRPRSDPSARGRGRQMSDDLGDGAWGGYNNGGLQFQAVYGMFPFGFSFQLGRHGNVPADEELDDARTQLHQTISGFMVIVGLFILWNVVSGIVY